MYLHSNSRSQNFFWEFWTFINSQSRLCRFRIALIFFPNNVASILEGGCKNAWIVCVRWCSYFSNKAFCMTEIQTRILFILGNVCFLFRRHRQGRLLRAKSLSTVLLSMYVYRKCYLLYYEKEEILWRRYKFISGFIVTYVKKMCHKQGQIKGWRGPGQIMLARPIWCKCFLDFGFTKFMCNRIIVRTLYHFSRLLTCALAFPEHTNIIFVQLYSCTSSWIVFYGNTDDAYIARTR